MVSVTLSIVEIIIITIIVINIPVDFDAYLVRPNEESVMDTGKRLQMYGVHSQVSRHEWQPNNLAFENNVVVIE